MDTADKVRRRVTDRLQLVIDDGPRRPSHKSSRKPRWGAPARCPMPWGRRRGNVVTVSEREVDGLELALPGRPQPPLDAFIDLRETPDGLALAPSSDAVAEAPVAQRPLADARGFLHHYQQLAAGGDALCAAAAACIALLIRFGTWDHVSYDA